MIENYKKNARFFSDVGGVLVKCTHCAHRIGTATCKAFPEGIPFSEIVTKEGECNNGICFKPIKK